MTQPSNIPIPDPTLLTGEAIARLHADVSNQIAQVEKALLNQIACEREGLTATRELLQETIDGHWRLDEERFRGVDQRFAERDVRSEREARDNKTAVDAAFAAQKEAAAAQNTANTTAIGKSEESTKEQLVKLGEAGEASRQALGERIDAMKDTIASLDRTMTSRINDVATSLTNQISGVATIANVTNSRRDGGQQATTATITQVMMVIAMIGLAITIITKLH